MLSQQATALDRSYALQTLGIVARDSGDVGAAIQKFRQGIALSKSAVLSARIGDLAASLGTALALAGRRRAMTEAFDEALLRSTELESARVLVRRGAAKMHLGDHVGAYEDCIFAAAVLARASDRRWEANARHNAGTALMGMGRFQEADEQLVRVQELAQGQQEHFDATVTLHVRGACAYRMGDLPRALELLYDARRRYDELGVVPPEVVRDLAVVQLAAGLPDEAAQTADEMVAMLRDARDAALRRADGFIAAATVHLAAGTPERAVELARSAARSSKRQGHVDVERHARVVLLRAQAATGNVTKRHARAAAELATELKDRYSSERLDALVLAGRMALDTGLPEVAEQNLSAAAAERNRGSSLRRATAWYAQALRARADGDRTAMLRACSRGLDVLDTHALSLGATELRARATVHGSDLAILATRTVAFDGTARELLRWTERWRSSLHALPWPEAEHDPVLAAELGRLRAAENVLGTGGTDETDRRRIEERIRRHVHGRYGDTSRRRARFEVPALLDHLGDDRTLVSIVGVKGERFHVVVARRGRVQRMAAGHVGDIRSEVDYARFALRGAALANDAVASALLTAAEPGLARLQETLLGPAVRELGDGPVVLVPPSTLQAVPWGALPALRDRDVTVAPSAAAWMRARQSVQPESERVALIAGSGLSTSAAEVDALAGVYPDATVLTGQDASAEATLGALEGSWLAHIGAHCRYRGDNPMFSALELADGPLTVYDFERLRTPPYRMLLTACESGVGSPTGADELLGLTTSLSALGTAGLMASVVPVSDAGSVDVSLAVHERLRAGDDLSTALRATRQQATTPVATATAWSFLALGAA
ncbi:CHAT domain-containing protein [Haloactinopolyspora alba]|uniref:CHAT domain-containing protein n=1 Tax=Haloactinopolyspora alba TaxID=648780 RepID=A0A2P8DM09_9ACTN|nr:CHAT domain-containing protein [Haloactinopolyspora alba]